MRTSLISDTDHPATFQLPGVLPEHAPLKNAPGFSLERSGLDSTHSRTRSLDLLVRSKRNKSAAISWSVHGGSVGSLNVSSRATGVENPCGHVPFLQYPPYLPHPTPAQTSVLVKPHRQICAHISNGTTAPSCSAAGSLHLAEHVMVETIAGWDDVSGEHIWSQRVLIFFRPHVVCGM